MEQKITPKQVKGCLQVPPSKSMGHRLLICAGLAHGTSVIRNIQHSKDMEATMDCLKSLGAKIEGDYPDFTITGTSPKERKAEAVLNCQESGSTIRFMLPVAALSSQEAVLTGKGRLLSRPMDVYVDIFEEQELMFEQSSEAIKVRGPLQGGEFTVPGNVSSQFISGLLLAGPFFEEGAEIAVLPPYESRSYVDMTVAAMRKFGVLVSVPTENGYIVSPARYKCTNATVEGDFSQAAFMAVLAAIKGEITLTGLNPSSLQSDRVIFNILKKCGAEIVWNKNSVTVRKSRLTPIHVDLSDCPDLGPVLCVLAAYIPGRSVIDHCRRLRLKESDRIEAMERELHKWGVNMTSTEDTITIEGKEAYKAEDVVSISSHNDHRIAMAMAVFGTCAQSDSVIMDAQAVTKSWPGFFEDLKEVTA